MRNFPAITPVAMSNDHSVCQPAPVLASAETFITLQHNLPYVPVSPTRWVNQTEILKIREGILFTFAFQVCSQTGLVSDLSGVGRPVGSPFESCIPESQTLPRQTFPPSFLPSLISLCDLANNTTLVPSCLGGKDVQNEGHSQGGS